LAGSGFVRADSNDFIGGLLFVSGGAAGEPEKRKNNH